jgi:protein-tyrosine phosphatase
MVEIIKNRIHLGSLEDYFKINDKNKDWSFVHIENGLFNENNVSQTNKDYYILKNHFYLKWQDLPNLDEFNVDTIEILFNFLDNNINKNTFIHCMYGQSRSPAITMAYLSKRTELTTKNFYEAIDMFKLIYPDYFDAGGITNFLKQEWNSIK